MNTNNNQLSMIIEIWVCLKVGHTPLHSLRGAPSEWLRQLLSSLHLRLCQMADRDHQATSRRRHLRFLNSLRGAPSEWFSSDPCRKLSVTSQALSSATVSQVVQCWSCSSMHIEMMMPRVSGISWRLCPQSRTMCSVHGNHVWRFCATDHLTGQTSSLVVLRCKAGRQSCPMMMKYCSSGQNWHARNCPLTCKWHRMTKLLHGWLQRHRTLRMWLKWRRATLRPQPMVQPAKVAIFIWNSGIMRALLLGMDDEAVEDGISPQHTIYGYYHETPGYCRKCLHREDGPREIELGWWTFFWRQKCSVYGLLSGNLTLLLKIAIEIDRNSWFSHENVWFSIVMLVYPRVFINMNPKNDARMR